MKYTKASPDHSVRPAGFFELFIAMMIGVAMVAVVVLVVTSIRRHLAQKDSFTITQEHVGG